MSQNGKGSAQRRQTKAERKRFEDNYDSIFKKTPSVEPERVTRMSRKEFDALGEYSTTMPTSPSIGRRWKRGIPWDRPSKWYLAEVHALPEDDPKHKIEAEIRWSLIEVVEQSKCQFCSLPKPCGCPGFDHQGWG